MTSKKMGSLGRQWEDEDVTQQEPAAFSTASYSQAILFYSFFTKTILTFNEFALNVFLSRTFTLAVPPYQMIEHV